MACKGCSKQTKSIGSKKRDIRKAASKNRPVRTKKKVIWKIETKVV